MLLEICRLTCRYASKVAQSCARFLDAITRLNEASSVPHFFSPALYRFCASACAFEVSTCMLSSLAACLHEKSQPVIKFILIVEVVVEVKS